MLSYNIFIQKRKEVSGTINSIIEAIGISLGQEFGDGYEIRKEEEEQGLNKPCFLLSNIHSMGKSLPGKRYLRENQFCVRYIPWEEGNKKEECYAAAERLFTCLAWLQAGGKPVRGGKMRCEVADGMLHFYVNYDIVVGKGPESVPVMEEVSSETLAKG